MGFGPDLTPNVSGNSQNQGESEVIDDTEGYRCRPGANRNHVSKTLWSIWVMDLAII